MKLGTLLETFYAEYDNPKTLKAYRYSLGRFVDLMGGEDVDVTRITPLDIKQRYQIPILNKGYSVASVRSHFQKVKRFFNWCVELMIIKTSPAVVLKLPRMPERINDNRAMSDEDYEKLLIGARSDPRNYALITFLGESGVRAVGASRMRIPYLDIKRKTALVLGKGNRERRVWFGPTAAAALEDWLKVRPDAGHDYIFSSTRRDAALDAQSIGQIIRRLCKKVRIKPRGSHSLRYRLTQKLVNNNVDVRTRMIVLGHKSFNVHLGYMPAETDRAARAVADVAGQDDVQSPRPGNIVSFNTYRNA